MSTIFWLENLREEPLARPRRRWEDNIRMNLRERGWVDGGLNASDSGWGPVVGSY